jgi:hypothetical protein
LFIKWLVNYADLLGLLVDGSCKGSLLFFSAEYGAHARLLAPAAQPVRLFAPLE